MKQTSLKESDSKRPQDIANINSRPILFSSSAAFLKPPHHGEKNNELRRHATLLPREEDQEGGMPSATI